MYEIKFHKKKLLYFKKTELLISLNIRCNLNLIMETNSKPKKQGKITKLRFYLLKRILSYFCLEHFTELDKVNKKFNDYFKKFYKILIIKYYLKLNANYVLINEVNDSRARDEEENLIFKFKKNFLKETFIDNEFNSQLFSEIFSDMVLNRFLLFAAYKNEGGYDNGHHSFHVQNLFKLNESWFCSSLENRPFNIYAGLVEVLNLKIYNSRNISKDYLIKNNNRGNRSKKQIKLKSIKSLIEYLNDNQKYRKRDFIKLTENRENMLYCFFLEDLKALSDQEKILNKIQKKNTEKESKSFTSFMINSCIFSNYDYRYTCPVKTFALFIHDDLVLNKADIELLAHQFHNESELINFLEKNNRYQTFRCIRNHKKQFAFYEFDTLRQRYFGNNLKLLLWVTTDTYNIKYLNLKKFEHFGKYLIIQLINSHKTNTRDNNIDVKFLQFTGSTLYSENYFEYNIYH